ncbi:MAG: DUF2461 domain-containing protein [Bacteroidales bacterium]|mgnify:FL=1|nr:DUF2461 domain-containing protein [Bacteroidales bacterium]MBK9358650.1 DUF2461 domain-containing protein [Bacteroidales bacterium]
MKQLFEFLGDLRLNNNREWFDQNRTRYQTVKTAFEVYIDTLIAELSRIDPTIGLPVARDTIFRIFRDVRFSADKLPYKTNFGAFIANGGRKSPRAGYYIHLEPGSSMIGGGIYMPQPDVLKKLRQEIYFNSGAFKDLLEEKNFRKYFGKLETFDKLKRPPKDFDAGFADIDLLMYRSYAVMHHVADETVFSDNFTPTVSEVCGAMVDFNRFLNRIF